MGHGKQAVVESTAPLRAKDLAGHQAPTDTTLVDQANGLHPQSSMAALTIVKDGKVLAQINSPSAVDADGQPVPVSYAVSGDRLEIRVDHAQRDVRYPVLVDPYIVETFYFNAPAGTPNSDWTGWQSLYTYS